METLTPFFLVIESSVKNSREARNALRAWLDELDRDFPLPEPKPATAYLPTITVVEPTRPDRFHGISPFYADHPEDYWWEYTYGTWERKVAHFERDLPKAGQVKMNYYYTTGTVQLVYANSYWNDYVDRYGYAPFGVPRRLQETFRDLDSVEFRKLLRNPPTFFGKGI
jgi:hypothetical protein